MDITHTGFIPGENIPVTITLDNPTDLNVDKLKLILNLLATYKSAIPEEAERKKILHINSSKISAVGKKCKRIFSEHIKIPATPPTCLYLSNIINIEYELDIVATIANFKGLFGVKVPLIIGIVPLHKYGRNIPSIRLTNNTKDTNRYSLDSVGFYPMNIDDRFESITEEEGAEEEEEEEEEQLPPYVPDQVDGAGKFFTFFDLGWIIRAFVTRFIATHVTYCTMHALHLETASTSTNKMFFLLSLFKCFMLHLAPKL